ncbi:MAG: adenylyltransferase/cytidyltransferase family protein [Opitutaceae bacterium]|nr:adenylyltransferase/cytidyltransferase family protein [Opitutaceae bacterium]
MTRVLTYGTFDVLHRGHIRLLTRARALGDYLVVGLSSDSFNQSKGKTSVFCYRDRELILKSLRQVDLVTRENSWEQKIHDIKKHDIDIFVIGDDWAGKFDHLRKYCQVVYLPRTTGISTTALKRKMAKIKKL